MCLKISVFSYVFYPETFLLNELVKELSSEHDVTVYTGLPNYPLGEFFEGYSLKGPYRESLLGARVVRYPHTPRKTGKLKLVINYLTFTLSSIFNIFRLKKSDVAFVFASSPVLTMIPAILHKWRSGCKVVVWLQDIWPEAVVAVGGAKKNSLSYKIISKLVRWMYSGVDVMLVQSNKFDYNLDQHGFKGERIWVPNWAPEFEDSEVKMSLPDKKHFRVTFAGNIGRVQGLNTLIKAAWELKNQPIEFLIVGDGSEKSVLEKQAEGLDNVVFLGRRPLSEMPSLFEQSDALFVGLKDDDLLNMVIPSKLQAYLTAKKPVVAMLSGAGAELCQEMQSGPVVPPGDSKALAQALIELSQESEAERAQMGERAYKTYIKHFQKKEVVKKITNILQDAVKS